MAGRRLEDRVESQITGKALQPDDPISKWELLDIIDDPISVTTIRDGRFIYINQTFSRNIGYSAGEVIGRTHNELDIWKDPDDRNALLETLLKDGEVRELNAMLKHSNGTEHNYSINARAVNVEDEPCVLSVHKNIDALLKLKQNLDQKANIEGVGLLAGNIAHDFNNALMGILGNVSLIKCLTQDPKILKYATTIEDITDQTSRLAQQLLQIERGTPGQRTLCEPNQVIESSLKVFQRINPEIRIHKDYSNVCHILADPGLIGSVLLNLYTNARDAMNGKGNLRIRTSSTYLDSQSVFPYGVSEGEYVKIEVSDNGSGMDEQTKSRIFDPFFTTKEAGKGTGLGLASVYGNVKDHGGIINVYSELGTGTTFNIYLPRSTLSPLKTRNKKRLFKGDETILIIDDDEINLNAIAGMVTSLGYDTRAFSDREAGVRYHERKQGKIDLVILDLTMPGMEVNQAIGSIRQDPKTQILMCSGYPQEYLNDKVTQPYHGYVQKPFSTYDISAKIREVLDQSSSG